MLGIGTVARKVFGTPNDRKIKATRPLVEQINALEPEFEALSDEGMIDKTEELQERGRRRARTLMRCCPKPSPTAARPRAGRWACGRSMCS